jgi:hypothetical protein
LAETIVAQRITTKEPQLVAALMADHFAGMAPTAIANKHHTVVKKVVTAVDITD